MRSAEEQAVARALQSLVSDPAAPRSALGDEVERRYRRRRKAAAGGIVAALVGTVLAVLLVPGTLSRWISREVDLPAAHATTSDPAAAIRHGRFVRTLVLDAGALNVEPPPGGKPATSEQEAVATFRSSSLPSVQVEDVLVGYGVVTVRPALLADSVGDVPGAFDRRPAWLVFYRGGPHGCPGRSPGVRSSLPEGRPVFVLGESGAEAVTYVGRGSFCGQPPTGPVAQRAYRYVSVPWQEVRRTATTATVRYQPPACGRLQSSMQAGGRGSSTLTLFTEQPLAALLCPQPAPMTTQVPAPRNGEPLRHGPTGPALGYVTGEGPDTSFHYSRD